MNNTESKIKNAILVNEFSEYGVKQFKMDFDELNSSPMPIIPIFIDSFGGEIYSLLAMLDIISTSTKPIATIALGKAMSCGSILLACGSPTFRFVGPHSTVMIHDAATFSFGKIEDLKADVGEAERLNHKIFGILNDRCNKPKDYFQNQVASRKHVNWYLDAAEVVKHGLADHVGIPVVDSLFNLDIISLPKVKKVKETKQTKPKKKSKKK